MVDGGEARILERRRVRAPGDRRDQRARRLEAPDAAEETPVPLQRDEGGPGRTELGVGHEVGVGRGLVAGAQTNGDGVDRDAQQRPVVFRGQAAGLLGRFGHRVGCRVGCRLEGERAVADDPVAGPGGVARVAQVEEAGAAGPCGRPRAAARAPGTRRTRRTGSSDVDRAGDDRVGGVPVACRRGVVVEVVAEVAAHHDERLGPAPDARRGPRRRLRARRGRRRTAAAGTRRARAGGTGRCTSRLCSGAWACVVDLDAGQSTARRAAPRRRSGRRRAGCASTSAPVVAIERRPAT